MDTLLPFIIKALVKILFLLGSALVAIWFYFRIRPGTVSPPPVAAPGSDDGKSVILPLKLQACERLILFLERIRPNNLILRIHSPDMSASQLQGALVRTVREEFDYNLSQQLYVSSSAWEHFRNAKEETITIINRAASALNENATSRDLAAAILNVTLKQERSLIQTAIEVIKREIG